MGISQRLCEVRDRKYGGKQYTMATDWKIHQATLSRWIRRDRTPDQTWYNFLSRRLSRALGRKVSIEEVHRLCMADLKARMPAEPLAAS